MNLCRIALFCMAAGSFASSAAVAAPFELVLEASSALGVTGRLVNRSSRPQWALIADVQPSLPELRRAGGDSVPLQDDRATSKFDNRPHRHLFVRVPPGASVDAGDGLFEPVQGYGYTFRWGWMHGAHIAAGCYELSVVWQSRIDSWIEEGGQRQRVADLWLGSVRSRPLRICLP